MSGRAPKDGRKRLERMRARGGSRRAGEGSQASVREAIFRLLESMGGTPERAGLQSLWDNWEKVLGPELAALAMPLGHHGDGKGAPEGGRTALLLGAEDAMLLQELRFRGEEILERVNGFLGQAYFCEVRVSLPLGRNAPVRTRRPAALHGGEERGPRPAASGVFLKEMDENSPVARCYARFAKLKKGLETKVCGTPEEYEKK